jgi:general secretion pathway protein G
MTRCVTGYERGKASAAGARGFTLVEILIVVVIVGILAAIVVPQFSNAAHQARETALRDDLRFLRVQVGVFAAQHSDVPPGYPGGDRTSTPTQADFIDQMLLYTDANCATSTAGSSVYKFGPYLTRIPSNPLNGLNTVMVIANGTPLPAPDDSTGWIYKPETKEVIANLAGTDATGTAYTSY